MNIHITVCILALVLMQQRQHFAIAQELGNEFVGEEGPGILACDIGPNALTDVSGGKSVPRRCFAVGSQERCYYTFVPDCALGATPLVYDIHGGAGCPLNQFLRSGWFELAQQECFIVVWPTGNTELTRVRCFDLPAGAKDPDDPGLEVTECCCDGVSPSDTQDLAFFRQIGSDAASHVPATNNAVSVDTKRIYATGISNGCIASIAMAMEESDFTAAVACMGGAWHTGPSIDYSPTPIWMVNGKLDSQIPYDGGENNRGQVRMSFQSTFKGLSHLNGCTGNTTDAVDVPSMDLANKDGILTTQTATGCDESATVQLLTLSTAGHSPYKGTKEIFPPGAADTTVDTTVLAYDFMKQFQLDADPPEFLNFVTADVDLSAVTATPTTLWSSLFGLFFHLEGP